MWFVGWRSKRKNGVERFNAMRIVISQSFSLPIKPLLHDPPENLDTLGRIVHARIIYFSSHTSELLRAFTRHQLINCDDSTNIASYHWTIKFLFLTIIAYLFWTNLYRLLLMHILKQVVHIYLWGKTTFARNFLPFQISNRICFKVIWHNRWSITIWDHFDSLESRKSAL